MFGQLGSMFGRLAGNLAPSSSLGGSLAPPTPAQITAAIGPPRYATGGGRGLDPTQDHILSDIFSPPYRGPGDLDNYGGETPQMRHEFRTEYHEGPVLHAAIRGKADDICGLEPTVLAGNKDSEESNAAAEFVKDTIRLAPGGWPGLLDSIYTPGAIDGWSVCEKKLRQFVWRGFHKWGLAHVRSIDTVHIRLQTDVYRNVVGVVNMLRGLEYYDPSSVILYTHNGMYGNPFGHSDVRPVLSASKTIAQVYMIWYVALKVYGLPYMTGKVGTKTTRQMLEVVMQTLRAGGWAVIDKDDEIETLNLATGAALNGFESIVRNKREDIFYGTRGSALPFLEGKGTSGAHGDTQVEQESSDASERMKAHQLADVINHQLIPWLVTPNFTLDESEMPWVKFGGTNWKQIGTIVDTVAKAKKEGARISADWFAENSNMPAPRDENDILETPQEKQARLQAEKPQPTAPQPGGPGQPALPAAQPTPAPAEPQAATFSAEHKPQAAVSVDQLTRVVAELLKESAA